MFRVKGLVNVKIVDSPSRDAWDSFLAKFGCGNLQQSYGYGDVASMINPHTKVVRLLALDGNAPVGLVQARYNKRFGISDHIEVGGVYGYGPVVDDVPNRDVVFRELILSLEKYASKDRACEALVFSPKEIDILENLGYVLENNFNVYKVYLGKSVEELWKRIEHNKRRNIKKAQSQGVKVICSGNEDTLASFYEMHVISGKRAGFTPQPFSYFDSFLKVFGAEDRAKVFLTMFNDSPVAGVFVVVHCDTAYALGAGSMEETWQVRPNDILHWKAMEWACKEGLTYYHMGYVSQPPPTEGSDGWGLWRWKREWGGILERVYIYHKVLRPGLKKFVVSPYEKIYSIVRKLGVLV